VRDTKKEDVQEKVEPPTACIASDIGTEATAKPTPALGSLYVTHSKSDATSNTALVSARRHLKLDLDGAEWVHAEHGYDSCECIVLQAETAAVAMTKVMSQQ
jgi:hypothetical protein